MYHKKTHWGRKLLAEVFMLVLSLVILIPLAIMLLGSFKTSYEANYMTLTLPSTWHPENYMQVIEEGNLIRAFWNSIILTLPAVAVIVLSASSCAFYLARIKNRVTTFLTGGFNLGLVAPFSIIPSIWLLQMLKLNGTFAGVIFLNIGINIPFSIFLYLGFIKSVPREMDDAAIIDGCSSFRLFFRVIFPLLKPVTITSVITSFMGIWNDFTLPLYLLDKARMWPMPLSVYSFFGKFARDWNLVFADIVLCCVPVLLVYILGQKYIVSGLTAGAVKT